MSRSRASFAAAAAVCVAAAAGVIGYVSLSPASADPQPQQESAPAEASKAPETVSDAVQQTGVVLEGPRVPVRAETSQASQPAPSSASGDGLVAIIPSRDKSGEQLSADEEIQKLRGEMAEAAGTDEPTPPVEELGDGTAVMRLEGRFRHVLTARVGDDGETAVECDEPHELEGPSSTEGK